MTRSSNTPITRKRRKRILKQAKGYFGSKHKLFKTAKEQLMHSWTYAYRDRKQKKRDFRRLWILRINNACRAIGLNYSRFIRILTLSHIKLNRKQLSEMCVNNLDLFKNLVIKVKNNKNLLQNKPSSIIG